MILKRKHIIILLILIGALCIVCTASSQGISAAKTSKTTVKIYNFKSGELWAPKAKKLKNGDAIAGYVQYSDGRQYDKGTGVVAWYVGNGNEDIDPHHIKLVKAKFYFKNDNGKIKTKTIKGNSAKLSTKMINGYKT